MREVEANKTTPDFESLMAKLEEIRASLIKHEARFVKQLSTVHPAWRKSASNLLHYLALRQHDIRLLQETLAMLGLSSLGRSESHVMNTVDAVLQVLRQLAGRSADLAVPSDYPSFNQGMELLTAHTETLLGPVPAHRGVRIMVTMSSEAAENYMLVRDLVSHGMNCMRINCAHDTPEIWARMIANLERARRELALPCRILMDIAGPKLRTGAVEPGPEVVVWRPKRDSLGRVVVPARIWLVLAGAGLEVPMRYCRCRPIGWRRSNPASVFNLKMRAVDAVFSKFWYAMVVPVRRRVTEPHILFRILFFRGWMSWTPASAKPKSRLCRRFDKVSC
jgi:pyruvate kinase